MKEEEEEDIWEAPFCCLSSKEVISCVVYRDLLF